MTPHERVHRVTAGLEGGYLSSAQASALGDPGGATRFGISQRLLDSLGSRREAIGAPRTVEDVTPQIAERIGRELFWQPTRIAELAPISPALALAAYDCAFQSGPERAARLLQRALGVREDGVIGPQTIRAAATCEAALLVALDAIAERRAWLVRWAAQETARARLLIGLHRRCDEITRAAVQIEAEARGWSLSPA